MLLLQDSSEPYLVPRVVKELLGAKLVTSTPLAKDILSPLAVEGKVVEGCPTVKLLP
jgi:hypothetical protein